MLGAPTSSLWAVPIADAYDGFLIDLDGVVWIGHELIPGAGETIAALLAAGKRLVFVTNSPRLSPAEQAGMLRRAGLPVEDDRLVTAGTALIDLARDRLAAGAPLLAIGSPSFRRQVEAAGFEPVAPAAWERAEAVLATGHDRFGYDELKGAAMAARAGVLLAATGRDPTMPMPDGLWPGTGAILAAIEVASGRTAVTVGKPAEPIFRTALARLGLPGDAPVAMVGDRLDTDIRGAHGVGLDGILVAGNDSSEAGGDDPAPRHRIGSLAGLLA